MAVTKTIVLKSFRFGDEDEWGMCRVNYDVNLTGDITDTINRSLVIEAKTSMQTQIDALKQKIQNKVENREGV